MLAYTIKKHNTCTMRRSKLAKAEINREVKWPHKNLFFGSTATFEYSLMFRPFNLTAEGNCHNVIFFDNQRRSILSHMQCNISSHNFCWHTTMKSSIILDAISYNDTLLTNRDQVWEKVKEGKMKTFVPNEKQIHGLCSTTMRWGYFSAKKLT